MCSFVHIYYTLVHELKVASKVVALDRIGLVDDTPSFEGRKEPAWVEEEVCTCVCLGVAVI